MKTRDMQTEFIFTCEAEAREVSRQARTMAGVYGRVTLADINEIIGNRICYEDTKIYWTPTRFDTDVKVYPKDGGEWVIHIFDYLSDHPYGDVEGTEDDESHPIYINITTSDMDDPDGILCSVLAHAQKISDRDIFINVY